MTNGFRNQPFSRSRKRNHRLSVIALKFVSIETTIRKSSPVSMNVFQYGTADKSKAIPSRFWQSLSYSNRIHRRWGRTLCFFSGCSCSSVQIEVSYVACTNMSNRLFIKLSLNQTEGAKGEKRASNQAPTTSMPFDTESEIATKNFITFDGDVASEYGSFSSYTQIVGSDGNF